MKKITSLLAFGLLSFASQAQKCKYDFDKTDPFTKESVKSSTFKLGPKVIDGRKNYEVGWTMTLEKNGKDDYISFKIILFGKFDEGMAKGQKIYLRLENDQMIELVSENDVLPSYMTGVAVYTHYDLRFKVEAATMHKLSEANITNIKMERIMDKSLTADIDDGKAKKIMNAAACFE